MVAVMERRRRLRRAGRRAHDRYEVELKEWRRRNRRSFRVLTGVVALVVAASILLLATRNLWAWIGGLLAGVTLAFLVAARDSPPVWVENYRRGGWGEQRTARTLESLVGQGWVVLHDLTWRGGNIDHVVVGRGGVFVLDTKNWAGGGPFRWRRALGSITLETTWRQAEFREVHPWPGVGAPSVVDGSGGRSPLRPGCSGGLDGIRAGDRGRVERHVRTR